jgi:Family of unknown function (DUF6193)
MDDRGDALECRWQELVSGASHRLRREQIEWERMDPFVVAASKRPELRRLFPIPSMHGGFRFSRCTKDPFSWDLLGVEHNSGPGCFVYDVRAPWSDSLLGAGDADCAADLVVQHLPQDCGVAFVGSVVELAQQIAAKESVSVEDVLERLCPVPPGWEALRPQVPWRLKWR